MGVIAHNMPCELRKYIFKPFFTHFLNWLWGEGTFNFLKNLKWIVSHIKILLYFVKMLIC